MNSKQAKRLKRMAIELQARNPETTVELIYKLLKSEYRKC